MQRSWAIAARDARLDGVESAAGTALDAELRRELACLTRKLERTKRAFHCRNAP